LTRAVANPTQLALVSSFATAALVFGSWWLLLIGLMSCVAFAVFTLSRPKLWQALSEESHALRLPEPEGVKDPALQPLVAAFSAGRSYINQILSETPEEVKLYLRVVLSSLDEVEHCAARLVLRAQELTTFLRVVDRTSLEDEVRQLSELAQHTTDAEIRRAYDSVLCWQKEQLRVIDEVSLARERAVASLIRTVVIVKGLPLRIVDLRMLDVQMKDGLATDLNEVWEQIREELQSSEQILKGLGATPSKE
jgi:hypothetical protein